jgi:hypothetical protein
MDSLTEDLIQQDEQREWEGKHENGVWRKDLDFILGRPEDLPNALNSQVQLCLLNIWILYMSQVAN